jgi:uncharacterized membrane protein YhdT
LNMKNIPKLILAYLITLIFFRFLLKHIPGFQMFPLY